MNRIMRTGLAAGLFGLGVLGGAVAVGGRAPVVHAQSQYSISGCKTVVPKSWGAYRDASLFGLAFEDDKGTVRFIGHPNCGGISESQDTVASSIADLTILRQ